MFFFAQTPDLKEAVQNAEQTANEAAQQAETAGKSGVTFDSTGLHITAETWQDLQSMIAEWLVNALGAVIVLIIGWWLSKLLAGVARKSITVAKKDIDPVVVQLTGKVVRATVLAITLIAVLNKFGVETTSIIAVLGASVLAIGMALQGSLSNVASGVMLMVLRPFDIGHAVRIGGEVIIIDEIGLFITRGHTPDGPQMVFPNSKITSAESLNYSVCHDDQRRINEVFGIGYDDDINLARQIIAQVLNDDPRVLPEPEHQVLVDSLGDSSVNIVVRAFTMRADWWDTRCDVIKKVKEAFDANGISIPFPQRDLHLYTPGGEEESAA